MNNLSNNITTLDDFNIERVIGKGSFGSVYLVRRKVDQKIYALKTVFLEKLNKKEQENSVNEVRLLASVSHPNVIGYKEAFWDEKNSSLNIIMEYADDGDLQTKINKKRKEQKYFNENLIWLYSIQMIEGLKALHDKKIMHRDLKSANIFLTKNNHQCKLGDMNVSKVIKEKFLTTQTGTPYYASPEVWRNEPYSYKSDLWSIGCVIYEMCELRPPFNGNDLDELFENICKGKIRRISNYYSDDLWKMILMLLQHDVNKRVDCQEFLNSELIKNKINEFKSNPNTYAEGLSLEKNRNSKIGDDILFETINFKNFYDLKKKLPIVKNYESNKNSINSNSPKNINISKCKTDTINTLIANYSMKSNAYQNLSNNNIKYNNSSNNGKKSFKKKIGENINLKSHQINNYFYIKEKQINIKPNSIKKKEKNKDIVKELLKNISFNGINHSSYVNVNKKEKSKIIGISNINSSDRNLLINKNSKNKEHVRYEKKKIKEFEKIIEYNKIKDLLKISKKKENNTNRTERRKNDIKKSCGNLFRNQNQKEGFNNKKIITKPNNDIEDSGKIQKNISFINSNKSNLMNRISTEQKISLVSRLYNIEFGKKYQKKIVNSPTVICIVNNNTSQNKERSHSQGINGRTIESINNSKLSIKNNRMNNKLYNSINSQKNKNINRKKKKILQCTPYSISGKVFDKSSKSKRNLTIIPYNNESKMNIKSIKNYKKKNRLLNEVFHTVNFNVIDNNIIHKSVNHKYNYYLNLGNYFSEIDRLKKSSKPKKGTCQSYRENKKHLANVINKKKRYINILNNRSNENSNSKIFINNSCHNNQKKFNLINYKNYSIIINKDNKNKNSNKNKTKTKSNDNVKVNYSKKVINKVKNNPRIENSYNLLSLRQKSLASSIGGILNNSNNDLIKKRNSFIYNLNIGKKEKVKNISIKKINIPPFCNININNNKFNNFIRYKNYFKNHSNKDIMYSEPIIYSNRERTFNKKKNKKKLLNVSVNDNYISYNQNTFLHNVKPIYLNIKNNNKNLSKKNSKNINRNKRINTTNPSYTIKNNKLINSQIFNNYYSINNIDASNLPVRVINFYN